MTIFIFDWRSYDASQFFDWQVHQSQILEHVTQHTTSWNRETNVMSKYMILILWPDKAGSVNQDECRNQLKRIMAMTEDCIK